MLLKPYGVRGSCASAGKKTARFGGNTSSYQLETSEGKILLDAGTGLRDAGNDQLKERNQTKQNIILLSHYHWDHIQGIPFFKPAYIPNNELIFFGRTSKDTNVKDALFAQMQNPHFPVTMDVMAANKTFENVEEGLIYKKNNLEIYACELNHPGGVVAYKIKDKNKTFVYTGDHEHDGEAQGKELGPIDEKLIAFAQGADLLLIDAQYTPQEYNPKRFNLNTFPKIGWGHSTYEKATEIAIKANAKRIILTHHDPDHDDDDLEEILKSARLHFLTKTDNSRSPFEVELAIEGQKYLL